MNTSIEAYQKAKDSGFISNRQWDVIKFMLKNPGQNGVSQRDVDRNYKDTSSSFHPRFAELEDSGVIECIGTKIDPVSTNKVKTYALVAAPTTKVKSKQKTIRLNRGEVEVLRRPGPHGRR